MGMIEHLVDKITKFETGGMSGDETVSFFQELADTGIVWQLQGLYQRCLLDLVDAGLVHLPEKKRENNAKESVSKSG